MFNNKSFHLLVIIVFFKIIFANSNQDFISNTTIIPFQKTSDTSPIIHLGIKQSDTQNHFISAIQIQPTYNLLIGGTLSPIIQPNNMSIYYNFLVGYLPNWKFFNFSNIIQLGMHRYRFGESPDSRWFHFLISESIKFKRLNTNISLSKMFNKKWEKNLILVSTQIKLLKSIFLTIGTTILNQKNSIHSSFLSININI